MMVFVFSFLIAIGMLTTLDRSWTIVGWCFILVGILVVAHFKKIDGLTWVVKITTACILAGGSVALNNFFFVQNIPLGMVMMSTGTIVDIRSPGNYLFQTSQGDAWSYRSSRTYRLGDIIYTTAYVNTTSASDMGSDFFVFTGWSFDYSKRLRMKGRQGSLFESAALVIGKDDSFLLQFKQYLRDLATKRYPSSHQAGLVLGMIMGDRSLISKTYYQQFINSGLVHVIAVSGGNFVLLIVFLSALLFRVPYYVRLFLLAISVVIYATLCGRDSSVMRATLMGVLTIGALLAGRMSNSWRLLGIVLVVMLIRNPYYLLYDLGFVFSFSAVVGIMIFQSRLPKYQGIKGHFMDYLTPTLGATLGVLPMLLFFTGSFNLLSLVVNMIVPPLIPVIMIGGSLTLMILSICSRGRITLPIIRCIDFFYQLASWTTQYGIYLQLDNPLVKTLIVVIGWTLLLLLKTSSSDTTSHQKPSSDTSPSLSTLF